jgi:hypothetical protein
MADLNELRPYSYGELSEFERPEQVFYLDKYIAAGQVSMLTAQPGTGKSYLTQLMSVLIATGGNWFDQIVAPAAVPVLYLMTEGNIYDIDERNEGPEALGLTEHPLMPYNWYVSWRVPLDLTQTGLQGQGSVQLLKNFIRANGIKVVFIDSLYSSMVGDPANGPDAQKVSTTMSSLRMEFPDVAWVIVHHDHRERQDSDGNAVDEAKPYLGHTFIEAMLDQMWNLRKDNGHRSVRFSQIKGRSRHQSIDSYHIELDKTTGILRPSGSTITNNTLAAKAFFQANKDRVVTPDMFKEWWTQEGIAQSTADRQRKTLTEQGVIVPVEGEGHRWKQAPKIEGITTTLAVNP